MCVCESIFWFWFSAFLVLIHFSCSSAYLRLLPPSTLRNMLLPRHSQLTRPFGEWWTGNLCVAALKWDGFDANGRERNQNTYESCWICLKTFLPELDIAWLDGDEGERGRHRVRDSFILACSFPFCSNGRIRSTGCERMQLMQHYVTTYRPRLTGMRELADSVRMCVALMNMFKKEIL